jgi:copper chaperone
MKATVKEAGLVFLMSCGMLLLNLDVNAQSQKNQKALQMEKSKESVETLQLKVKGMSCQAGCANGIDKMLGQQEGVMESKTTFDSSTSEVKFDRDKISEKEIIALIEERGFKTKAIKEE